jgi:oligopeptide/dipeptide ABC transporter ATP-binding protein
MTAIRHPLLHVEDLKTYFFTARGVVKAVDGVSFSIDRGDSFGLVGESGCGKTMTALSILRLVPGPAGRIVGGKVFFDGQDLLEISKNEMRTLRGARLSMIPQDPMTSLNPVLRVGKQIGEIFKVHLKVRGSALLQRCIDMLRLVRIPSPDSRVSEYPHQFSGGMRQRVMISMALSCQPDLIIADEPTTALDVTIQAQILNLMQDLQEQLGTAHIFITHDLGIVAHLCQRVAVMYAGKIVEQADTLTIFENPRHPYTRALIGSVPRQGLHQARLYAIEGQPPDLLSLPEGCSFHPRCPHAQRDCRLEVPGEEVIGAGHSVRCLRWQEI